MFLTFLMDLALVVLWGAIVCIFCKVVNGKNFDENKSRYQPYKWEKNGKWYSKTLKINKWKDLIPQYVTKGGFSKEHFGKSQLDLKYIDRFILETCRAEWAHSLYPLVTIPLLLLNKPLAGIIISAIVIVFSFLVVSIQRYNRFRLQRIRRKLRNEKETQVLQEVSETSV